MQPLDTSPRATTAAAELPAAETSLGPRWWLAATAILALLLPTVVYQHFAPVTIATQQITGVIAWGAFLLAIACQRPRFHGNKLADREVLYALSALGIVLTMTWVSVAHFGLPGTIAMDMSAMVLSAAVAMWCGHLSAGGEHRDQVIHAIMQGLIVMGAVGAVIAALQFFLPQLANPVWLSSVHPTGRAGGNVGQPNHLSTLTIWAFMAVLWWRQRAGIHLAILIAAALVTIAVVLLSGSRTGMLCFIGMMLWAAIDEKLEKRMRMVMLSMPLVWLAGWWLARKFVTAPAMKTQIPDTFARFTDTESSGNRLAIWLNSLELLAANPLGGTGAWLFNHKWVLSPVAGRPKELFDNAHNIFVNIVTEFGIPVGFLLAGLLVRMFWMAITAPGKASTTQDNATMKMLAAMLAAIALHSQLESPLMNSYFLLPTAFALGLLLSWRGLLMSRSNMMALDVPESARRQRLAMRGHQGAKAAAVAMMVGGMWFGFDYAKVQPAFDESSPVELTTRLKEAESSVFFSHHAHHLRMTTPELEKLPSTAAIASRTIINYSVLAVWSGIYEKQGDTDRAYHLLQRMREMRPVGTEKLYALCTTLDQLPLRNEELPLHCRRPSVRLGPNDFP